MGLKIDGIAASSAIDTSSEAIDIENLDISSLKAGQGVLNYEHRNPKQPGASFLDILGAITYAHKIMNEDDCEDDRQRAYWEQVQLPFVYIKAELFDDEKHPGAVAAAAIIRFYHSRKMPILVRFSIDGHTIERDGNVLRHCIARDVALTIKPANHSCVSGVLDGKAKVSGGLDELSRSQDGLQRLPGVEFQMLDFEEPTDPVALVRSEIANLQEMTKAMSISGAGMTAPGDARGGAALVKEDVAPLKQRLTTAYRDWNRRSGKTLQEHLVKAIPDVHPDFLQKFVELVTENQLRKASELHEYLNKALGDADGTNAGVAPPKSTGNTKVGKPVMNDDEGAAPTPADHEMFGKEIDKINATIPASAAQHGWTKPGSPEHQRNQQIAATRGEPLQPPPGPPHVPGLRVGVHPDHAETKDIEAINASIRQTNPNVDQQGWAKVGSPEWQRNQTIMRTVGTPINAPQPAAGPTGTAVATPQPTGNTAVTAVVRKDEAEMPQAKAKKPPADDNHPLTIRGTPIQPNHGLKRITFDEQRGVLRTPKGDFPMYIPSQDSPAHKKAFHDILNDPHRSQLHDYAIEQWANLRKHLKAGTLPPAVMMHAALFSILSANKPVPQQELMFGHLVDQMRESGVDARDPNFGAQLDAWRGRDNPANFPQVSKPHWDRIGDELKVKTPETDTGRKFGDIIPFAMSGMKPGEQGPSLAAYHTIHNHIVNAVQGSGGDARKATRQLLLEKTRGGGLPGLAPKTIRYAMGMLGMGNSMVPDTHFIRYLFGLDRDKDARTIEHLKQPVLWRDSVPGADTLDAIDRYYFKHHDAVQHMLNHPKHGQIFRDDPESAIFPAFWKNWIAIVPHEKLRGLTADGMAHNQGTDHRVYWDAVSPFLKAEQHDDLMKLAARTAQQHHEWIEQHGEVPAMMLYCSHLLPHLLAAGSMQKAEPGAYTVAQMPKRPPQLVQFGKDHVEPGEIRYRDDLQHPLAGKTMQLLSSDDVHHTVVSGSGPSGKVLRVPRSLEGKAYEVVRPAVPRTAPKALQTEALHHFSRSPEQLALAARIDFSHPKRPLLADSTHANHGQAPWVQGGDQKVFIKPSANYIGQSYSMAPEASLREAAYHNVARDAFGMGHLVPTTVAFWHPEDGRLHSAQDFVHGGNHVDTEHAQAWHAQGLAPKMAVMDHVLGASPDRWEGNIMRAPDGSPRLIDNGFAFQYNDGNALDIGHPSYVHDSNAPWHPEMASWINGIDEGKLQGSMLNSGLRAEEVEAATGRLNRLKQMVAAGVPVGYNHLVRK